MDMVIEEATYEPLTYIQKHVMLSNGLFEFDNISNTQCVACSHFSIEHLDGIGVCLIAKGGFCICQEFRERWEPKTVIKPRAGKLPKKVEVEDDPKISVYLQTLSKI
jgi:hypothetical protein